MQQVSSLEGCQMTVRQYEEKFAMLSQQMELQLQQIKRLQEENDNYKLKCLQYEEKIRRITEIEMRIYF